MKNNNKLLTGLVAGTTAGILTFLFVKPNFLSKPKKKNINSSKTNSEDLFI